MTRHCLAAALSAIRVRRDRAAAARLLLPVFPYSRYGGRKRHSTFSLPPPNSRAKAAICSSQSRALNLPIHSASPDPPDRYLLGLRSHALSDPSRQFRRSSATYLTARSTEPSADTARPLSAASVVHAPGTPRSQRRRQSSATLSGSGAPPSAFSTSADTAATEASDERRKHRQLRWRAPKTASNNRQNCRARPLSCAPISQSVSSSRAAGPRWLRPNHDSQL